MPRKLTRRRDGQQWILDYVAKTSGMVQNFEDERFDLPRGVKNYKMISKFQGEDAAHKEAVARAAEEAGRPETALELYIQAAESYRKGQHVLFEDDHPQKLRLHAGLIRCYDKAISLAAYPIERLEVPFEGGHIQVLLHLLPDRRRAPCVLYIPGMDQTKEFYPYILQNDFLRRGMHACSMDGPGQGMSNIRKIRVTHDNYERAAQAVVNHLAGRPEVDAEKIGVFGISMGSFWAPRTAALEPRVRACAAASANLSGTQYIFEQASPRFKQVFMYMAGIPDEDAFDRMAEKMTLAGHAGRIRCPVLLGAGEFDPLTPVEGAFRLFEELTCPQELWILENEFHRVWGMKGLGGLDLNPFAVDWLREALNGNIRAGHEKIVYIRQNTGAGPYKGDLPEGYPGRW
ncbi:MAG: alpha/beta hydrolase [Candidatus Tectomicrobia bacterium]|nr:alpha/beta hydrolase [Candidatus Tectomicrobia bacterium]